MLVFADTLAVSPQKKVEPALSLPVFASCSRLGAPSGGYAALGEGWPLIGWVMLAPIGWAGDETWLVVVGAMLAPLCQGVSQWRGSIHICCYLVCLLLSCLLLLYVQFSFLVYRTFHAVYSLSLAAVCSFNFCYIFF